jgi:hypothetical protein
MKILTVMSIRRSSSPFIGWENLTHSSILSTSQYSTLFWIFSSILYRYIISLRLGFRRNVLSVSPSSSCHSLSALGVTQSIHDKICIGMHRGIRFQISRIPLIVLVMRLGWTHPMESTDWKFCQKPNLNTTRLPATIHWMPDNSACRQLGPRQVGP